jgi:hypothetical protein
MPRGKSQISEPGSSAQSIDRPTTTAPSAKTRMQRVQAVAGVAASRQASMAMTMARRKRTAAEARRIMVELLTW